MMQGTLLVFARDAPEASAQAALEVQRVIVKSSEVVIDDARLLE